MAETEYNICNWLDKENKFVVAAFRVRYFFGACSF